MYLYVLFLIITFLHRMFELRKFHDYEVALSEYEISKTEVQTPPPPVYKTLIYFNNSYYP
jgi:hypothetical protein